LLEKPLFRLNMPVANSMTPTSMSVSPSADITLADIRVIQVHWVDREIGEITNKGHQAQ